MSTVAVSTESEKSKFSLRSSFRKPKHKGGVGAAEKDEVEDVGLEELLVMPVMTTKPIYCYRDENDKLIRTREYGRVKFSEKPVEIGLAAPRTFSRNYTRSKNKKKSNKHQESQEGHQLMKLFQSPEVLERLDTVTNEELHDLITSPPAIMSPDSMDSGIGTLSPEIPAEVPSQSKPKKPLMSDPNMVDLEGPSVPLIPVLETPRVPEQIKLSFFRPPVAGTWVPPPPKKEEAPRSDGESEADDEDDDSEENVYFVDQAERDEEALNILSNLDNDDDGFFNDIMLVETNIDEVIKREVKETCIDSAPILLNSNIADLVKETSLCEGPSVESPELSPVKDAVVDHESEGSVDSGVEAGTDSPSDEASPSEEVPTADAAEKSDDEDKVELEISPPTSPGGNELCYLQYNEEPSRPRSQILESETSSDDSDVPDIPERPASPYTPPVAAVSSPQRSPRIPQKFLSPPSSPARLSTSPKGSPSNSLQRPSPRNSPFSSPSKPRNQPHSLPRSPARADAILGQVYIPIEPTFHLPASSSEEDQVVIPRTSLSAVATTPSPTSPSKPISRSASPLPSKPIARSASPCPSEEKVEPRSGSFSSSVPTLAAKRALEQAARTPPPTRALPPEPLSPPLPPKQAASPAKAQRTPPVEQKQAKIVTQTPSPVEPKSIPQMAPMSRPPQPAMIPLSRPPPPAPIPQQTPPVAKRPPPLESLPPKPQTPPVARRLPPVQPKVESPLIARRPLPVQPKVETPPIARRPPPVQPKVETPPIARRPPPIEPKAESPIPRRPVPAAPKSETPPIIRRPIIAPSPQTPPPPLQPQQMSTPPPLEEQRLPTPPTPIATPPTKPKGGQMIYPDRTPVEVWKPPPPTLPAVFPAPTTGGMSDFDDIDNLLMDLLENDPLIARQELIRKNEIEQQRSAYEEKKRREAAERTAIEAAIQHARDQEEAQILAAQRAEEEKEKKVQDELEARREKKRQMREMSLDDILKMSKNKPKRSPTLSIRSEASGSIRRASSESLNEKEGKDKKKLSASSSSQSMIAPLSMLDELLDPPMMFAQPISSASPNNSSAGVFITSTITRNTPGLQQPPRASPSTTLRGVPETVPETLAVQRDPVFELPTPGSDTTSPNAAISQAQYLDLICNTGEATLQRRTRKSNATPAAPVQTKPAEPIKNPMDDWGDLDDLLKDVECMATDLATDLSEKMKRRNSSDQSLNSIGSSSSKVQPAPPLPPRPAAPLPPRQFQLQPQIPEHGASAFSPPPSAFSPPNRTFSPSRLSDTSSINSQCSDSYVYNAARATKSSERQQSPSSVSDFRFQRSNTLPHNYNRGSSAFQEPAPSDHTRSFRRKSSIDDLQKRTEELRLQKRSSSSMEQPQRGPIQPQYPEQREVVQWDQMARAQAPSLAPVSPQYHPGYNPPQAYHPSAQYHPHHEPPRRQDNSREFNQYPRDQYNPTSRDPYNNSNRSYDPRHDPRTSQRHEPRAFYEPSHQQYSQPPRGQYVQHEMPRGQYNEPPRGQYEPPRGRTDSSNSGQKVILNNNHHTMV